MQANTESKNFRLVHQLPRRVRIIAPSLRNDPERAYILEMLLVRRSGVERVKIVVAIASVTIYFDAELLPLADLLQFLDTVLGNIGLKPRQAIDSGGRKNNRSKQFRQEFTIGISGMTCSSCALFLEIVLRREADIIKATVDYPSARARVKGYLTKASVIDIIEANGYQAFPLNASSADQPMSDSKRKHRLRSRRRWLALGLFGFSLRLLSLALVKLRLD